MGAITAKVEVGEEHKGLLGEYWGRRDELLDSLHKQVKGVVEAGFQHDTSETLHHVAVSQDKSSFSMGPKDLDSEHVKSKPTLAERKRLLNLSKIAAVAGKGDKYGIKVMCIDADLNILKLQVSSSTNLKKYLTYNLQEEIMRLLPDGEQKENLEQQLLPLEDLIELCLRSQIRELSLHAFEIFAWTGSSFQNCNRSLLEEGWKNAADQDDWGELYQASIAEGWSDEATLNVLIDTILFQAASRCYGPHATTYEGGFEEVLQLRNKNLETPISKYPVPSVEAILMQHRDFPDAGKLMLTAIMLGSVQSDVRVEESFCPLE
ncbi:hypothetical protein RJ641_015137 [Dillenia turbinata]|uniref:Uncharacterized protein n=1 Tax=Dillenia turbinata TaxID=194707 RepID=A0AAN8Z3F1_9MAGN